MQEAIVRNATSTFRIIEGEQLNNLDDLTVNSKPILIVKGGNAQHLTIRVFTELSKRLDRAGKPFTMSMSERGLKHSDPYGRSVRMSAPALEEYLDEIYQYVELVHGAAPQTYNSPKPTGNPSYLKLMDKLPAYVNALLSQSRFVDRKLIELFEIVA